MIKARAVAGDIAAGRRASSRELAPFIWRKYLDFAAIADIHAMKRQIHAFRGFGTIGVAGHNIKLGRGGIREIEFFAQTQQLIAGGRQPDLRVPATLGALDRLAARGWIKPKVRGGSGREPTCSCGASSIACRWSPTSRRTSCPPMPTGSRRLARFAGFASTRAPSPRALVAHLEPCSATTPRCSRTCRS